MTSGPAEFQRALVRLGDGLDDGVAKLTGALARFDRGEAMRYVTDAYPELATPYIAAAGDLSATWYEDQPVAVGAKSFIATPAPLPTVEQLAANGRWSLTQADPSKALQGAGRRATFNQSRETIANNAEEEGARWVRHARAGACGFCRMLATRVLTVGHGGAPGLYRSEGSASRNSHRLNAQGHDFCRCVAVPLRGGAEYVVPDYLPQWLDDYEAVSRDADGRLLPAQTIANRMEGLGRERGEYELPKAPRRGASRPPKVDPTPDVVDLDAPSARERVADVQRLAERNAERAEQIAAPVRDRVAQAAAIAERADAAVVVAARVSGQVKSVVDTADTLLGSSIPVVRNVKAIVDATDRTLQTASQITTGVRQVASAADQALSSAVDVAHGIRQVADEAVAVFDEAAAIAAAARALVADTGKAAADVRDAGSIGDRIDVAVERTAQLRASGADLIERARGAVDDARGAVQSAAELPDVVRRPIADVQALAEQVRDLAAGVDQAIDDGAAVGRQVRRLADAVADWRAAQRAASDDVPRPPVRVDSQRLDVDQDPPALPAVAGQPKSIDAPEAQRALTRAPDRLAIEAPRQPKMLTAAPARPAIEPPDPQAIAAWLDAEDAHRAAVEYWRRVDAEDLHSAPSIPAAVAADPAADVALTPASAPETVKLYHHTSPQAADDILANGFRPKYPAGTEASYQSENSQFAFLTRTPGAQGGYGTSVVEVEVDRSAVQKDAWSGHVKVRVEDLPGPEGFRRYESPFDKTVREFEEALESGDEARIGAAADAMQRAEAAEKRAAAIAERAKARRDAAKEAEAEEIGQLIEEGTDPAEAEVAVLMKRPANRKKAEADVGGAAAVENRLLDGIRRRDFIAQARADGHTGKGFDELVSSVFSERVDELYIEAENATNGFMLRREFDGKVSPKRLWYVNEATARKYMSEEMATWFDENGRITRPVLRQMILDGQSNWSRYTAMVRDFNQ